MEHSYNPRERQLRDQGPLHAIKVMACGGMIGTAILFPLANAEGLWLRTVTLAIFILSTLGFHALHIKPFIRYGPFTAAAALIILIVAVLSAGPSRKELIPWLPVFIASLSLITVAIYEVSQFHGLRPLSFAVEDEFSGVSIDTWSERSYRTLSTQPGPQPLFESNRLDRLYFVHNGPASRSSHRTGTAATDITLSGVAGQCQPHWDPQTLSHFRGDTLLPEEEDMQEPHARIASPGQENSPKPDLDMAMDMNSDDGTSTQKEYSKARKCGL
ncbi:hypothetical protein N0V88_004018 [Collariella sp. IMI 366227]|nr:hypothetical protein N0V88_004018 [Collariella sp. IMI 366227]